MTYNNFFKLSEAQLDIFYDQLNSLDSPMYNVGGYLEMPDSSEYSLFKGALSEVIEYFDVCHVKITQHEGEVVQYVDRTNPCEIVLIDFTEKGSIEEAQKLAFEYVDRRMATPFSMIESNLVELGIIKLPEDQFVPFARCHHVLIDGVGFANLIDNISKVYNDQKDKLSDPDFRKAIELDNVSVREKTKDYWKALMGDFSSERIKTSSNWEADSVVSDISQKAFDFFSTKNNSFATDLLTYYSGAAAWVMANVFDKKQICLALPSHRRRSKATKDLIAHYASVSPMLYRFDGDVSVSGYINRINQQLKESYRHIGITSSQISSILNKDRYSGIYDIVFNYSKIAMDKVFGDDIACAVLRMPKATSAPLRFVLQEYGPTNIKIELAYEKDIFSESQAKAVLKSINNIVESFIISTEENVRNIACFRPQEKTHIVSASLPYRELISKSLTGSGSDIALCLKNDSYSYKELKEMVNSQVEMLEEKTSNRDCVAIVGETSVSFIAKLLAIIVSGRAFAILDSSWGDDIVKKAIDDVGAASWVNDTITPPISNVADYSESAYVVFTSGSTGKPKAIRVSDDNLSHYLYQAVQVYALDVNNSIVISNPSFDLTLPSLLIPFMQHGQVALANDVNDVDATLDMLFNHQYDSFVRATPSHLLTLLGLSNDVCSSSRVFVIGGEAFPSKLHTELRKRFSRSTIYNHYGPSETTIGAMFSKVNSEETGEPHLGNCFEHVAYRLVNSFELPPLVGNVGEILIGGKGLTDGYINTKRSESFFSDSNDLMWYRTGDLASVDDKGCLRFKGRKGRYIKIKGVRLDVSSLEDTIYPYLNGSRFWVGASKENDRLVVAVETSKTRTEVEDNLEGALPLYLKPIVVCYNYLPANGRGKLDNSAIRDLVDREVRKLDTRVEVNPASASEETLCRLWSDLVKSRNNCVATHFFDLGGNSLHLTKLSSLIKSEFGVVVTIEDIYKNPNIRSLSALIDKKVIDTALINAVKADSDKDYTGEILL